MGAEITRPKLPGKPFLYAVLDGSMLGSRSLTDWVNLVAGEDRAAVLQWRFKALSDDAALSGARELRAATRRAGVLLVINDRPDIARIVEADGVHVGQDDLDPAEARSLLPEGLVGVSTHDEDQFESALASPADYIAVGPVFPTASKADPDPVVGLPFVSWAASRTVRPVVAIGGLGTRNAGAVIRAGALGVAVISELLMAEQPEAAARSLYAAIRHAPNTIERP